MDGLQSSEAVPFCQPPVCSGGACPHADGALAACAAAGVRVDGGSVRRAPAGVGTAVHSAALDGDGDLVVAYADMAAMDAVTPAHVAAFAGLHKAKKKGSIGFDDMEQEMSRIRREHELEQRQLELAQKASSCVGRHSSPVFAIADHW